MYTEGDGRKGNWMQTFTGIKFYPLEPRPEEIVIEDIAHGLSNTCRYNGHVTDFYSVAEHSVLMSYCVPPEAQLVALLHDASEAFICDIPKPLKLMIQGYEELEYEVQTIIYKKFLGYSSKDMPADIARIVKGADLGILVNESEKLMGDTSEWGLTVPKIDTEIYCWTPKVAEKKFLQRFKKLQG